MDIEARLIYLHKGYLGLKQMNLYRMTAARSEDMRNAIQTRSLLARGGEILKQVKRSINMRHIPGLTRSNLAFTPAPLSYC